VSAISLAAMEEVRWVINEALNALKSWDRDTVARIFASDDDAIHFGTAADEVYVGGSTYIRAMERQHTVEIPDVEFEFIPGTLVIKAHDAVGWAIGQARISGTMPNGRHFMLYTRITFVLEQRPEGWQIVHTHFSQGAPRP
jgi:ketosteroid isomerase-like protein